MHVFVMMLVPNLLQDRMPLVLADAIPNLTNRIEGKRGIF